VITRRYFMDDKLLDSWYDHYLAGQVAPHIGRLYWRPTPEQDGVDLVFNGLVTETRLLHDGSAALAESLAAMAGYLVQSVWKQETLATYLAQEDLRTERVPVTASEMWAASAPLLDYDKGAAPDVQAMTILGVNATVRDTKPLTDNLAKKLSSVQQMRQLDITDPYSMLLARMVDVIPSSATTPHRDAEQVYKPMYGLTSETVGQGRYAPPRATFPAEVHALVYEQRLPELNQMPRLFHPLFVAALEDEAKAVLFVKAWAGGLVHTAYRESTEMLVVDTAHDVYPLLDIGQPSFRRVSPLAIAMLHFVTAPDHVLTDVATSLQSVPDLATRWQRFVQEDLSTRARSDKEGTRDLAAFADLVLYDLRKGHRS